MVQVNGNLAWGFARCEIPEIRRTMSASAGTISRSPVVGVPSGVKPRLIA